jgi:hypothetical protein
MLCNPLNTVQINSVRRDVLLYYTQQLWIKNDCSTPLLHINPTPFLKKIGQAVEYFNILLE